MTDRFGDAVVVEHLEFVLINSRDNLHTAR